MDSAAVSLEEIPELAVAQSDEHPTPSRTALMRQVRENGRTHH